MDSVPGDVEGAVEAPAMARAAEAPFADGEDPRVPTDPEGVVKELPCGLVKGGVVHRHAEFVPSSGRVRKAYSKKGVREDFAKVAETVLRMCVLRVGGVSTSSSKTLADLPMADRDFLLLEIRRASASDTLRAIVKCPGECGKKIEVTFRLDEIEVVRLKEGDYEIVDGRMCFRIRSESPRIDALCRFPIGSDQDDLLAGMDRNFTEAQYKLFASCLVEWDGERGPFDQGMFDDMRTDAIDEFTRQFAAKKPGPVFDQSVECPSPGCGEDIEFTFNGSDFFFPLPTRGRT